ncbi:MAG: hypothetical protein HQ592_04330 [Planctomycetes bacterium]|nr:hypothetical protein [Planctomycetota bacterium]
MDRFKEGIDWEISNMSLPRINWSCGTWQLVLGKLNKWRKEYIHLNSTDEELFPETQRADEAITIARAAIKDIYAHVGKPPPQWADYDTDRGWDSGPGSRVDYALVHAAVNEDTPDATRIAYVDYAGEHTREIGPAGMDPIPIVQKLIRNPPRPIEAVRVYRGKTLVREVKLRMRGGPSGMDP